MRKPTTRDTGEAGELAVMTELYRRGVVTAQTGRGTKGIDLLTSTRKNLQVKTKRHTTRRWPLRVERPDADLIILVSLGETHREDEFFVLPTDTLYEWAETDHRAYWSRRQHLTEEAKTLMRIGPDERFEPYRDAWNMVVATGKSDGKSGGPNRAPSS